MTLAGALAALFDVHPWAVPRQGGVAPETLENGAITRTSEARPRGPFPAAPARNAEREADSHAGTREPDGSGDDHAFLRGLDPLEALTQLDAMETADAAFLFDAYSIVLESGLSGGDRRAIRELLETVPRADVARMLIAAFSDVWARTDPAGTAAWIVSLPPEADRARVLGDVITTWAAREPERAAAFAATLPAGEARQVALQNALLQWRTSDLASASEWLIGAEPHPDLDLAIAALAKDPRLVATDPVTSLGWTKSIVAENIRRDAVLHILGTWTMGAGARPAGGSTAQRLRTESNRLSVDLR